MGKPVRPINVNGVTGTILRDMERGKIEYTEAISLIQRLRIDEQETFKAIIYAYDYGRWKENRELDGMYQELAVHH